MNKTYNLQLLIRIFFLIVSNTGIKRFYGKKLLVGELVRTFMVTIPMALTPFYWRELVRRVFFLTFMVSTLPASDRPLNGFGLVVVF